MYYVDKKIVELNRVFDQNKREGYLRLDLNENPGGLSEEFVQRTLAKITPQIIAQYPETLDFTETLAGFLGTDIEHICLVNGSSEGIRNVIEAFSRPGGRIVGVSPTYAMFEVYSLMYGRDFVPVKYTEDLQMPVQRILDAMTADTDLLILLNPNNPMGNVYTYDETEMILEKAEKLEITVLIDEAYIYFYPNEFLKYALEREHVFVTRTFSKLFSLAGLRLGYVVGWPDGIRMVQKLCTPHNVNAVAMLFAGEILKEDGMLEALTERQLQGKKYLIDELLKHDYEMNAGEGNFIFIKPKTDPDRLVARMKEEKSILIKTYDNVGKLGKCLRVTTGEMKFMKVFAEALYELDVL